MNKKIVAIGLIGCLVGQSVVAMETEQQKKSSWADTLVSGKSLAIGTGLAVGGTVAYKNKEAIKQKGAELLAGLNYDNAKKWGNYLLENKGKTALYAAAGLGLAYVGYKALTGKKEETQEGLQSPIVRVNGLFAGKPGSKKAHEALEVAPVWMTQLLGLLRDVYGDNDGQVKQLMRKAAKSPVHGCANPQVLFQEAGLIEKLDTAQKARLLEVGKIFTLEYFGAQLGALMKSLSKEQGFAQSLLAEAQKAGDIETIMNLFKNELLTDSYGLTTQQKERVKNTNEFISECVTYQTIFQEDHSLS